METYIVSRITDGIFRYQGWPTVCRDENGTLYCAASGHRLGHICPFGKDVLYKSTDGGRTWSVGRTVNDTCLDDRDAGLLYAGGGRMILTWFNHPKEFYLERRGKLAGDPYGDGDSLTSGMLEVMAALPPEKSRFGSFIRISDDRGETWSDPVNVPVTSPHGPFAARDGRLVYVGKEFHSDLAERERHGYPAGDILCCESFDRGETWSFRSNVPLPDGLPCSCFHEPHAVELPGGRILLGIRAQGKEITSGDGFSIYTCFSDDGGTTWSVPRPTGICGSPPHFLLHSSGAVVLTYGRRKEPFGERARISTDGGETFGGEIVLGYASDTADLGYPSSVELDGGKILTAYYQRYPGDGYCSIMCTVWDISGDR